MLVHAGKVDDVVGSIIAAGIPTSGRRDQSVKESTFLSATPHSASDQCSVADLLRVPQKRRGNLRVEKRLREHAHLMRTDDLQVLPTGVEAASSTSGSSSSGASTCRSFMANGSTTDHLVVGGELEQAQAARNRSSRVKTRCRWQARLSERARSGERLQCSLDLAIYTG